MQPKNPYIGTRKSHMELGEVYFWTSTLNGWNNLLLEDAFKNIIIESLQWLTERKHVCIYGFVIMPTHIHLLWEQTQMNGKEKPKTSFEKFTAHAFLKKLRNSNAQKLLAFEVEKSDRDHLFWRRDPLAIHVGSRAFAENALDYMHYNPQEKHWRLCEDPIQYRFSSALFYENGIDEFRILTHYMDRF